MLGACTYSFPGPGDFSRRPCVNVVVSHVTSGVGGRWSGGRVSAARLGTHARPRAARRACPRLIRTPHIAMPYVYVCTILTISWYLYRAIILTTVINIDCKGDCTFMQIIQSWSIILIHYYHNTMC